MTPTVAIVEPYRDLALTLNEVVVMAHCTPVTLGSLDALPAMSPPPAAIVVRVATDSPFEGPHAGLGQIPRAARPMVFALVSSDADAAEATRLGCEVVLRAPEQVRGLYEALARVAGRGTRD